MYLCIGLLLSTLSADAGHYSSKQPKEIRGLGKSKFATPPVSVLRPTTPDSCKDTPSAQVWVKFKQDRDGKPHDVQVVWTNIDDTTYEQTAKELIETKTFTPSVAKGTVPNWWRYHIVLFRSLSADVCRMDSTLNDSVKFTDAPILIAFGNPNYPPDALEPGVSTLVWITCFVDSEGKVVEAKLRQSCGNQKVDDAVVEAAYRSTYSPALRFGKPVPVWVSYPVKWRRI